MVNTFPQDHPIVLVSDGFNAVTGYPRNQIVGRNCRFLQGPGTTQESVQRVRDGLNSGEGCTELLLNYRT
jgi:PAS domain